MLFSIYTLAIDNIQKKEFPDLYNDNQKGNGKSVFMVLWCLDTERSRNIIDVFLLLDISTTRLLW